MSKSKPKNGPSDESIAIVRRAVSELETLSENGTLTLPKYKEIATATKKAVGKDWSDVAEAVENFKPKR